MARIKVNPTHVRKAMAHPVCAKLILNFSHRIRPQADCRTVQIRLVMTPGLESAPESDFGSFWTSDYVDSGSGSFSLESPESAPLVVLNISGAYYDRQRELPVISYFNRLQQCSIPPVDSSTGADSSDSNENEPEPKSS